MSPDERMYWRLATDHRNPFAGEYLAEALRRYGGPSNPLASTPEPYQRHPYCKLPDPTHQQWADDQADYRGLKDHTHGVRHSSKFPRYPVGRAERNPQGGWWAQGSRRLHIVDANGWNRAKPVGCVRYDYPTNYMPAGLHRQPRIERWEWPEDFGLYGEAKTKPRSPWDARPRA